MSWKISIGEGPGLTVYDNEGILAGFAGILMGTGLAPQMAESFGKTAVERARQYRRDRMMNWRTQPLEHRHPLSDGRYILLKSTDLPEDPNRQCNSLDDSGDRCGRSMNHSGNC